MVEWERSPEDKAAFNKVERKFAHLADPRHQAKARGSVADTRKKSPDEDPAATQG